MNRIVDRLGYWLLKDVNRAIREHDMIHDRERIAVAVSGGKDSLSLLRLLDLRQRAAKEKYELLALHVRGDSRGPDTPAHPPLETWLREYGYEFRILPPYLAPDEAVPLKCQRCTWNRRRTLFESAAKHGCAAVAFGHHADDLAQTTLLNLLQHGRVETMAPRRDYFDGRLRLIRPLCLVPEKDLQNYSRACGFPPAPPPCPQAEHSRRELVRDLLRQAQQVSPQARVNLLRAGLRFGRPKVET